MVRVGVRVRREGNAGFKLGRHLVFAAVLLHEVLAHRVGLHSELALLPTHRTAGTPSLDRPAVCVAGAGQRPRTTVNSDAED